MKRKPAIIFAVPLLVVGAAYYYLYFGNKTPNGQQPLSSLTIENFSTLKNDFNRAQDRVRIILTLSPT